jgi:hypothetical protein
MPWDVAANVFRLRCGAAGASKQERRSSVAVQLAATEPTPGVQRGVGVGPRAFGELQQHTRLGPLRRSRRVRLLLLVLLLALILMRRRPVGSLLVVPAVARLAAPIGLASAPPVSVPAGPPRFSALPACPSTAVHDPRERRAQCS